MFLVEFLGKPRGQRQRELHQTKGLMSRTMALYVRYKSLYISALPSAQQQREMTKVQRILENANDGGYVFPIVMWN